MLANRLISWATGVRLHDYGCSLKVFRAEVVKPLKLYGEMHRFLPAIASEKGVTIAEVVVNHAAPHGTSKYGISRTIRVMLDLLTVKFLLSYSTRPLQIFGLIGVAMGSLGVADHRRGSPIVRLFGHQSIANRPLLLLGDPADLHRRAARHAGPARRDAGAHLSRVAGQADLRDSRSARVPSARTDPAFIERLVVSVVLFSGGRGSDVLSRQLIGHPDVALTIAINGYDDGASTGEVRRFLGDSLGPSDFRKNARAWRAKRGRVPTGMIEVLDTQAS